MLVSLTPGSFLTISIFARLVFLVHMPIEAEELRYILTVSMPHGRHVQLYPLTLRLELLAVLLDLHHGDGHAVGGERERRWGNCRAVGWSEDDTATEGGA